jgi:hypothetical protein
MRMFDHSIKKSKNEGRPENEPRQSSIEGRRNQMGYNSFSKFLESQAAKNPLKYNVEKAKASRDAKDLAKRMSLDEYDDLRSFWQRKRYATIAFVLRKHGLEFKGISYIEALMNELVSIMEQRHRNF